MITDAVMIVIVTVSLAVEASVDKCHDSNNPSRVCQGVSMHSALLASHCPLALSLAAHCA